MRRIVAGGLLATVAAAFITACGSGPSTPTRTPPPPPVVVVNTPPQIKSVSASAASAEVGTPLTLTAVVEDAETAVAGLTYAWTADTGTFSGTGAVVTWVAGPEAKTPADVILTLTVTEKYTSGGLAVENTVTSTTKVHLNNSPKELAELSLRFLGDFATSSVSPEKCVSEFSDSCRGKKDEFENVRDNRHDFQILASTLRHTSVEFTPGASTAKVHTFCAFTSKVIAQQPTSGGCQVAGACPFNSVQSVEGDCWTTNVYQTGRWWLCESHFTPKQLLTAFDRAFFGIRRPEIP